MRLLPAALLAAVLLTGCATTSTSSLGAAGTPAASAPFYLEPGPATPAVSVINGFTGQAEPQGRPG